MKRQVLKKTVLISFLAVTSVFSVDAASQDAQQNKALAITKRIETNLPKLFSVTASDSRKLDKFRELSDQFSNRANIMRLQSGDVTDSDIADLERIDREMAALVQ